MKAVLRDVDTQFDFVQPGGKLAVPGAPAAVPALARPVAAARAVGVWFATAGEVVDEWR
jgi:nicotinamidase-related amidase